MIDLHSHLLPGVDDGSRSVSQSVAVLGEMSQKGVRAICLTPHLTIKELSPSLLDQRLARDDDVFRDLSAVSPPAIELYRGAELMLDAPFDSEMRVPASIRLGESRYLLVEFPPALSAHAIRGLLSLVVEKGFTPVVAHPERYPASSASEVFRWRDLGCAIQVDATTLQSSRGGRAARARSLVAEGLADILAADNHGDSRSVRSAWDFLVQRGAVAQAERLIELNPAAILGDRALEPVAPVSLGRGFIHSITTALRRISNPNTISNLR